MYPIKGKYSTVRFLTIIITGILVMGIMPQDTVPVPNLRCKYYVTGEDRKTVQFYPVKDWPIAKEWNIQLLWIDTNAPIVCFKSDGKCGTMRFKDTKLIEKERFRDMEYFRKKYISCDLFDWSLKKQLAR